MTESPKKQFKGNDEPITEENNNHEALNRQITKNRFKNTILSFCLKNNNLRQFQLRQPDVQSVKTVRQLTETSQLIPLERLLRSSSTRKRVKLAQKAQLVGPEINLLLKILHSFRYTHSITISTEKAQGAKFLLCQLTKNLRVLKAFFKVTFSSAHLCLNPAFLRPLHISHLEFHLGTNVSDQLVQGLVQLNKVKYLSFGQGMLSYQHGIKAQKLKLLPNVDQICMRTIIEHSYGLDEAHFWFSVIDLSKLTTLERFTVSNTTRRLLKKISIECINLRKFTFISFLSCQTGELERYQAHFSDLFQNAKELSIINIHQIEIMSTQYPYDPNAFRYLSQLTEFRYYNNLMNQNKIFDWGSDFGNALACCSQLRILVLEVNYCNDMAENFFDSDSKNLQELTRFALLTAYDEEMIIPTSIKEWLEPKQQLRDFVFYTSSSEYFQSKGVKSASIAHLMDGLAQLPDLNCVQLQLGSIRDEYSLDPSIFGTKFFVVSNGLNKLKQIRHLELRLGTGYLKDSELGKILGVIVAHPKLISFNFEGCFNKVTQFGFNDFQEQAQKIKRNLKRFRVLVKNGQSKQNAMTERNSIALCHLERMENIEDIFLTFKKRVTDEIY